MNSIRVFRSCLTNSVVGRMCATKTSYEEAVCKLNVLQSNKATIEQIRRDIRTGQVSSNLPLLKKKCTNLMDMENYLARTGVTMTKLDELSVIHVAGTKGKGSTSAMCESILRHHGFRTGFYSSPHLVAVRERIRLDGRVISEAQFAKHFHQVYDMLDGSKAYEGDMPKYFAFLTVMAFNVFLKEKVDVAIVEVGIGGVVDYTNVLRKVPVVGITALGLDHTSILGTTLPEIAAAKAGVMKPGCQAYTVQQPPDAMAVLTNVANSVKCPLSVVPDYKTYTFPNTEHALLPVDVEAYQTNASLAIQLAHAWMRITKPTHTKNGLKKYVHKDQIITNEQTVLESIVKCVTKETMTGLSSCKWPGRYHVVNSDYAQFYLDGAHTKESMEICAQWFQNYSRLHDKVLIFSATGDRDAEILLQPLRNIGFNTVYFVIPTAYKNTSQNNDNFSLVEQEELIARCEKHAEIWQHFKEGCKTNVNVAGCVADALISLKKTKILDRSSVLITGSLHLVGAALSLLDPNLGS